MRRTTRRTTPFGAARTSAVREDFANADISILKRTLAGVPEIDGADVGEGG
jgi:hypothetical protein